MKQFHTKGRENSGKLCVLPPLLRERAGVRASVSSKPIFGVGGSDFSWNEKEFEPRYLGCHEKRGCLL